MKLLSWPDVYKRQHQETVVVLDLCQRRIGLDAKNAIVTRVMRQQDLLDEEFGRLPQFFWVHERGKWFFAGGAWIAGGNQKQLVDAARQTAFATQQLGKLARRLKKGNCQRYAVRTRIRAVAALVNSCFCSGSPY